MQFALFIVAVGVLSLAAAKYIASQIKKADSGNEKMREIGDAIHEGSMAFLTRELSECIILFTKNTFVTSFL